MCGRYSFQGQAKEISNRLGFKPLRLEPRYNIAPTQLAPVIVQRDGGNEMCLMKWGLIPFWAKDAAIGSRMINARAESIAEKPAFRTSFKRRRCLVPADGFFEWKKVPGTSRKQPFRLALKSGEPFVMAGLWDRWKDSSQGHDEEVESFTIITTEPNSVASEIHNRMPAILKPDDAPTWLDKEMEDASKLLSLLAPYPGGDMKIYAVDARVNSPKSDDPQCIEPVETQGDLFG